MVEIACTQIMWELKYKAIMDHGGLMLNNFIGGKSNSLRYSFNLFPWLFLCDEGEKHCKVNQLPDVIAFPRASLTPACPHPQHDLSRCPYQPTVVPWQHQHQPQSIRLDYYSTFGVRPTSGEGEKLVQLDRLTSLCKFIGFPTVLTTAPAFFNEICYHCCCQFACASKQEVSLVPTTLS